MGDLQGVVLTQDLEPVPAVTVQVLDFQGQLLGDFQTVTDALGGWMFSDVPVGNRVLRFIPPAAPPSPLPDPSPVLLAVAVTGGTVTARPVFLNEVVAATTITSGSALPQEGLVFLAEPNVPGSEQPLPGLSLSIPAQTQVLVNDEPVADGAEVEIGLALIAPHHLQAAFRDELGRSRTGALFLALEPRGLSFVSTDTGLAADVQLRLPNVNGLAPGSQSELLSLDPATNAWTSLGTGSVTLDGDQVLPDAGTRLSRSGILGWTGPPPPVFRVQGLVTRGDLDTGFSGVSVLLENGFFATSDGAGVFSVDDVPVPACDEDVVCIGVTPPTSLLQIVLGEPTQPVFPVTTCALDFDEEPIEGPLLVLGLLPEEGAEAAPDTAIEVTFNHRLHPSSLESRLSVHASLENEPLIQVLGSVFHETVTLEHGPEAGTHVTRLIFVPEGGLLPANALLEVRVDGDTTCLTGKYMDSPFLADLRTGPVPPPRARVQALTPSPAQPGQIVHVLGVGLRDALVHVDGELVPLLGMSDTQLGFQLPETGASLDSGAVDLRIDPVSGAPIERELRLLPAGTLEGTAEFGCPPDRIPPLLVGTVPPNGAQGICTGSILAQYDELVATTSSMTVTSGGVELPGTVLVSGVNGQGVVEFFPDQDLPFPGATVVVLVQPIDLAGNPGAEPTEFAFTTGDCAPEVLLSQGKQALTAGNLLGAQGYFEAAFASTVATMQQAEEARFYLTTIQLALAFGAQGTGPDAVAFRELMAGFGFPPEGPDLLELSAYQAPTPLPADAPDCAQVQTYLNNHLIPVLATAEAEFALLSPAFVSQLPLNGSAGDFVTIDHSDVLVTRALLNAAIAMTRFTLAYGCQLDIAGLVNEEGPLEPNEHFLDADPTFLQLVSPGDLMAVQTYLRRAAESYEAALASLQAETGDQSTHLFVLGDQGAVPLGGAEQDLDLLDQTLSQIAAATLGPASVMLPGGGLVTADLSAPFLMLDLRMQLPELVDGKRYIAVRDPQFDPTLGGVFPGLMAHQWQPLVVPLDSPPVVPQGAIDVTGSFGFDWLNFGIGPATLDGVGSGDLFDEIGNCPAGDIQSISIAQSGPQPGVTGQGNYYVRFDLVGNDVPDPGRNSYEVSLTPGDRDTGAPDVVARIEHGGAGAFVLRVLVDGEPILTDAALVGVGPGLAQLRIPKTTLAFPPVGLKNGAEVLLQGRSLCFQPTFESTLDRTPPVRIVLNL